MFEKYIEKFQSVALYFSLWIWDELQFIPDPGGSILALIFGKASVFGLDAVATGKACFNPDLRKSSALL